MSNPSLLDGVAPAVNCRYVVPVNGAVVPAVCAVRFPAPVTTDALVAAGAGVRFVRAAAGVDPSKYGSGPADSGAARATDVELNGVPVHTYSELVPPTVPPSKNVGDDDACSTMTPVTPTYMLAGAAVGPENATATWTYAAVAG